MTAVAELGPTVAVDFTGETGGLRRLRNDLAYCDTLAWVVVRPPSTKDDLAPLTRDILTALGVVGLQQPRAVGERHLGRVVPHLEHGPVTDLVLAEAQWLPEEVVGDVEQACWATGVRLWLLVHVPVGGGFLEMLLDKCGGVADVAQMRDAWQARQRACRRRVRQCPAVVGAWWPRAATAWPTLPDGYECRAHESKVECLLVSARRELRAGRLGPEQVRAELVALARAAAFEIDDLWALQAAGLDLYTPCFDAVTRSAPPETVLSSIVVGDVSYDGSTISAGGTAAEVRPQMRPAVARQRSSNSWCNGSAEFPLLALFNNPATRR